MSACYNSANPDPFHNLLDLNNNLQTVDGSVNKTAGITVNRLAVLHDQINTRVSELTDGVFLKVVEASDESGQ